MLTIHSVRVAMRGGVVNSEAIAGPPRAGLAHPATPPTLTANMAKLPGLLKGHSISLLPLNPAPCPSACTPNTQPTHKRFRRRLFLRQTNPARSGRCLDSDKETLSPSATITRDGQAAGAGAAVAASLTRSAKHFRFLCSRPRQREQIHPDRPPPAPRSHHASYHCLGRKRKAAASPSTFTNEAVLPLSSVGVRPTERWRKARSGPLNDGRRLLQFFPFNFLDPSIQRPSCACHIKPRLTADLLCAGFLVRMNKAPVVLVTDVS